MVTKRRKILRTISYIWLSIFLIIILYLSVKNKDGTLLMIGSLAVAIGIWALIIDAEYHS